MALLPRWRFRRIMPQNGTVAYLDLLPVWHAGHVEIIRKMPGNRAQFELAI
jgi:hypothetical protein